MDDAAAGRRAEAAAGFAPETDDGPLPVVAAAPAAPLAGIAALLALQASEDPTLARRKAARRGHRLLDALEEMKADLLVGRMSEGKLNQLLALVGQARERTLPGLDGVLDEVELRARVELAKFGRFVTA